MANKYLFIESRDPFESVDSGFFAELMEGVQARGNQATVFLVQNGTLLARKGAKFNDRIDKLLKSKVRVIADRFALKERAITELVPGVEAVEMDQFIKLLMEPGTKSLFH